MSWAGRPCAANGNITMKIRITISLNYYRQPDTAAVARIWIKAKARNLRPHRVPRLDAKPKKE
jgi:hypothetical protein